MGVREELGKDLARSTAAASKTVTVQVVDVTDTGAVNVDYGGALLLDVPCTDAYRNRQAGDWVAMRPGTQPVVMWRLGDDPKDVDEDRIREIADDVAHDVQVVRAVSWGTGEPSGSGWQAVTAMFMRKTSQGKVELYARVDAPSDTPPDEPAGHAPKAVKVAPNDSGSWRGGRPDDYASTPTQGDWTGGGNRRGAWFYGSKIAAACAGKTVAKMTVAFTRRRGTGVNAKRPMHLYLHDYTSAPGGQLSLGSGPEELLSLSVGAKGSATLPASWRNALASGSARGLAIYANGRTDYAAFTGGTITITFSA
ncbi:hypothetical protein AVV13_gp39 [Streptomyces phage SF1]|uniref:Minor tail protein n=2 Tax=Caudoviricetes TaxID=2731619 RepID=A0A0K1Y5A0_9CAUD|nr:hypothetical protein [Streptomyces sp. SPB78]YP_009199287.1 hypothetical protein AVV13_gp39 [Streptomyces phage SF1]YP_009213146.1 hypothetical protein AVV12_gp19 [Streptomyces phage SF3]AKY02188.1 hypothetical protein SF1_390 [Streptomyces phage SF1]ALF00150.1 hypothetical protein SF3_190 [Streptomyces phage SF3]EFL00575.1 predicted protein [Streptomyces sp. SPB78]